MEQKTFKQLAEIINEVITKTNLDIEIYKSIFENLIYDAGFKFKEYHDEEEDKTHCDKHFSGDLEDEFYDAINGGNNLAELEAICYKFLCRRKRTKLDDLTDHIFSPINFF